MEWSLQDNRSACGENGRRKPMNGTMPLADPIRSADAEVVQEAMSFRSIQIAISHPRATTAFVPE
jgi:hypothetical protein